LLSTTDTQTVSNKTLGNTNILQVLTSNLTLQDPADNTKQGQFLISGNTTSTTRIYSLPDASSTLMDLITPQTALNKIFTSPTLNTPTLVNATVSANTITGFTTSNTGNIYGVVITGGVITGSNTIGSGTISAGAVGSTALATNAVQASQLSTNAITIGYAQITANFTTTTSTSAQQVPGLTVTVTVPAGGRRVKITAYTYGLYSSGTPKYSYLSIWDGVVGTTQLNAMSSLTNTASNGGGCIAMAIVTPAAGSKTYNIGLAPDFGGGFTSTIVAAAINAAYILVEVI
jgi:hypothetical protein